MDERRLFSHPTSIPDNIVKGFDAILVLGGGVPESIDHLPPYVERRADDAAAVVQRFESFQKRPNRSGETRSDKQREKLAIDKSSLPILCLSAGTAHLPQLMGKDGLPIWESTACAAYLSEKHGLEDLYLETTSYDTIGNAFYARTAHTDISGWRKLLVITNDFHMDRTMAIFEWIFLRCNKDNYELWYLASPNDGLTEEAVKARQDRESDSLKNIRENLAPQYSTLKDVWIFLTHEHSLYTAAKLVDRGRGRGDSKASPIVQQSYGALGIPGNN